MKSTISICFIACLMLVFTGCKKETNPQTIATPANSPLKQAAITTLQSEMNAGSFADLDLANAKEMNLNGQPALIIIPSKTNTNKSLYFGHVQNSKTANWVEHQNKVSNKNLVSETILLSDLQNNPLNRLVIKDNKLISSSAQVNQTNLSLTKKTMDLNGDPNDPVDLGEVVVTGYMPASNNYLEMYGLFWLCNFNPIYTNLYSLDQYYFNSNASSNELVNYAPNQQNFDTHVTLGTVTNLSNGPKQLTTTVPAFALSDLSLKFNYDPTNSSIDVNSFTSIPTGIFIGGWEFVKLEDITYVNGLISFNFTYLNTFVLSGINLKHPYKMHLMFDTSNNLVYSNWIP